MASGLYRVNPATDPIVSQIHSMLPNRSQKASVGSSGTSSARPSSAGATRRPGGATFGYNKVSGSSGGNTSNANIYNTINSSGVSSGLFGQGYNNSTQRPSSAGYSRPSASSTPQQYSNINQININGPPISNVLPSQGTMGSSSGRPKSAGAIRRNETQASQQQPQQSQQQPQQPMYYMPQPTVNPTYNIYSNPFGQSTQRPMSANATAYTITPHSGLANQWDAYKQYTQAPIASMQTPQGTGVQPVGYGKIPISQDQTQPQQKPRPQSASSTASKLRKAVDLSRSDGAVGDSHSEAASATMLQPQPPGASDKSNNLMKQAGHLPIAELAGLDNDLEDGLDGLVLGVEGVDATLQPSGHPNKAGGITAGAAAAAADDEEMDGKPIDSRSHPEVSMTTPSASLELHNGSSTAVDVRNTSLDSFSEENINIGITTVPNQFCSKRDALELRKLLVLSAGTRGGIVPSSSAVMDMYMVGKVVGVGSYGKVRAAWHRLTGAKVAIKTYDKAKLKDPAHWKRVHSEIKIMEQISHPRIARLYEAVETPKRMHLIMECLDGGNLCSYVKAKRRLSEDEAKRIFFQILTAIEYLHSLGVSHRDIKLENVLFANERDIKLIDFGFSTVCQPGKKLKVFCGTPSYMAPEIVRRAEYEGKPVDMWSLGILLYALLCGCFPFRAKAYPDLYRRIARGAFAIPEELSAPVKDLLRQLLTVEVDLRINAHAAMRHPWLQSCLLNAPNMDKMRQETTILISEKPADDLDEQVLSELVTFGMSRDETIRLVLTKTHSSLSTLYYLLLDCLVGRRRVNGQNKQRGGHIGPSMSSGLHAAVNGAAGLPTGTGATGAGAGGGGASMRPLSANYAAALAAAGAGGQSAAGGGGGVNGVIKPIPTPMTRVTATGAAPGTSHHGAAPTAAQQYESMIQQQVAEQLAAQQQQQMLERQEYRYRPKSASQNRTMTPSSAMAGNHPASSNTINLMNMASGQAAAIQQMQQQQQAVPTLQQQPQQRPLSAFAGRR